MQKEELGSMLLTSVYVVALTFLAGCTSLSGGAKLDYISSNTDKNFHGVISGKENQAAERFVLIMHGMGTKDRNFDRSLIKGIIREGYKFSEQTQYKPASLPATVHLAGEGLVCSKDNIVPPCTYESFGEFRATVLTKIGNPSRRVTVITYFWHDSMQYLKDAYLSQDRSTSTKAVINTYIKKEIIDDGFGDAVGYLSPGAGVLTRGGINATLCAMLSLAGHQKSIDNIEACSYSKLTEPVIEKAKEAEYSFITFSLGSRMLYDTLSDKDEVADQGFRLSTQVFKEKTRQFFMLANQMPLLGLGEVAIERVGATVNVHSDGTNGDFFEQASQIRQGFAPLGSGASAPSMLRENIEVVAFHDPGDLLGFRASGGIKTERSPVKFLEIRHRNTPVILGLLAWPASAHATELERVDSSRLVLCGGEANGRNAIKPYACNQP